MVTDRIIRGLLASVASVVLVAAHLEAAPIVLNGSFESGTLVSDGNQTDTFNAGATTITGWAAVGRQVSWIDAGNPFLLSAQDGNRFLDLTAYNPGAPFGGVTQAIATNPGQEYELTYFLGSYTARWGGPPVSILAAAGATSGTCTDSAQTSSSTWIPCSLRFTAASGTTMLTLTGQAGLEYIGLDNVSVNPVSNAVPDVPEPSIVMLLSAGMLIAASRWLRRRDAMTR
jgi:hypothetical protein